MQKEPGVRKGSTVYTRNVCTQALGVGEESACHGRRGRGRSACGHLFLPGTHRPTLPAVGGEVTRAQAESAEGSPEGLRGRRGSKHGLGRQASGAGGVGSTPALEATSCEWPVGSLENKQLKQEWVGWALECPQGV